MGDISTWLFFCFLLLHMVSEMRAVLVGPFSVSLGYLCARIIEFSFSFSTRTQFFYPES